MERDLLTVWFEGASSKTVSYMLCQDLFNVKIKRPSVVATGPKGTYVDNSEVKVPRLK